MNVQQLKVFIEMCGGRTLAEAADRLGLRQPTVSFHLRKLEEELGQELFRKLSRSLQPNEASAELLPYAKRIVYLMEEARGAMAAYRDREEGRLRIGASYTPATYVLPFHIANYRKLHDKLNLTLTVKQAETVLSMLRNYEVDAGIVSLGHTSHEGLTVLPLMPDELKLFLSPEHPLSAKQEIGIADLSGETFLLHEVGSTSRTLSDEWAAETGLAWGQVMELGAIETIKESVKRNIGLGLLPIRSAQREVDNGDLVVKDLPDYKNKRYICLVYRNEEQLSAQVRGFIEYIRQVMA